MPPKNRRPSAMVEKDLDVSHDGEAKGGSPSQGHHSQSRRQSLQPGSPGHKGALIRGDHMAGSINPNGHPPSSFAGRCEAAFNKFALTEGGSHAVLPIASVQNALYALELNPAPSRITSTLAKDGYSQRGLILGDFMRLATQFQETAATLHATIKNFKVLDTDNDDKISREEFVSFMSGLHESDRIVGRSLEEVMETLDPEVTGMIHMRGFLKSIFTDLSDEEILAAMIENGFDPDREAREEEERRRKASAAADQYYDEQLETLLGDERMLRTEIQADCKMEANVLEEEHQLIEESVSVLKAENERKRLENEAVERERLAAEAEKKREEDRIKAEEAEKRRAADAEAEAEKKRKELAAKEEADKKKKEEEERKRKEEEERKKNEKPKDAPAPKKQEESSCCVVM